MIYISTKNSDGQTVTIGMAHLESLNVKTGDTVKEGDNIGSAGSTGNAKGTPKSEEHVHLTVTVAGEKMNPQEHFAKAQIEKDK